MEQEEQGLKVIGVGLPRTGTWSTALALSQLLHCDISRIHHGMQLNQLSSQQLDFWIQALDGQVSDEDWRVYFRSFEACLDLPAIIFYKDLIRVFPQAIVVLTVRDPDTWYKSWHASIADSLKLIENPFYKRFLDLDSRVTEFKGVTLKRATKANLPKAAHNYSESEWRELKVKNICFGLYLFARFSMTTFSKINILAKCKY